MALHLARAICGTGITYRRLHQQVAVIRGRFIGADFLRASRVHVRPTCEPGHLQFTQASELKP